VRYHISHDKEYRKPDYFCRQKTGNETLLHNHFTAIGVHILDKVAWEKALETIKIPQLVRARVAQLREENTPAIDTESVEMTLESIRRQMHNLYSLAQHATNDETIQTLTGMLKDLEKQKRETEALLYDAAEDEEEREEVEKEIVKFEQWVAKVRPLLTDPAYTPSYEEQRLAVRILGIKATVFPASGDYPFRVQVDVTIPTIVSKLKHYVTHDLR